MKGQFGIDTAIDLCMFFVLRIIFMVFFSENKFSDNDSMSIDVI